MVYSYYTRCFPYLSNNTKLLYVKSYFKLYLLKADAEANEPKTFVFMSGDLFTNEDKLLLIIHGSGPVRAGQWSKRYVENDTKCMC